ncbi:hypothetical protein SLS58_006132 [Diplodia intermedia]|uniref:Uncharacterized protein n=1 Tax=Diplodia intermedia TaxID=856260 RepID=A0ABR3TP45_9PEZI
MSNQFGVGAWLKHRNDKVWPTGSADVSALKGNNNNNNDNNDNNSGGEPPKKKAKTARYQIAPKGSSAYWTAEPRRRMSQVLDVEILEKKVPAAGAKDAPKEDELWDRLVDNEIEIAKLKKKVRDLEEKLRKCRCQGCN